MELLRTTLLRRRVVLLRPEVQVGNTSSKPGSLPAVKSVQVDLAPQEAKGNVDERHNVDCDRK